MSDFPVIHLIFNIIIWMLWLTTFRLLLPHKYAHWITYLLEIAIFIPYYGVTMYIRPDYSVLSLMIGEALVLLPLLIFHEGKLRFKLLIWLAVFIISLIGDMFTYYISGMANTPSEIMPVRDYPVWQYLLSLTINIILLTMFILGGMTLRKQFAWELNAPQMILFLLYPISQTILLIYWLTVLWHDIAKYNAVYMILPFVLCILSDIALFVLIRQTASATAIESRVRLLEESLQHQESYYQSLAGDYERAIRIRSELVDQQARITALLDEQKTKEAIHYVDSVSRAETLQSAFPDCQNRTLAAFLQHRKEDLSKSGVRTSFSISVPLELEISDPDLICLFGNLLDNASEACQPVDQPEIVLNADWTMPYLRVIMDNSFSPSGQPRIQRVPNLERGIGFRILNQLTEKYDGTIRTSQEDGHYKTIVLWKGLKS